MTSTAEYRRKKLQIVNGIGVSIAPIRPQPEPLSSSKSVSHDIARSCRNTRVINALRLDGRNIDNSSQEAVRSRLRSQPIRAVVMPFPYKPV